MQFNNAANILLGNLINLHIVNLDLKQFLRFGNKALEVIMEIPLVINLNWFFLSSAF